MSLKNGNKWILKYVTHFSMFKHNDFCELTLHVESYNTSFNLESWRVMKGKIVMAKGSITRSLYVLECNGEVRSTMDVVDSNFKLWHERLQVHE